ncbi:MAG: efflux RND transporter periplasmic adaptor subunit [Alteromonadaceae bacterium]|nr:efflux RND transporter periplasmic adaptor subunit [Alteromonadaceae bacterium]
MEHTTHRTLGTLLLSGLLLSSITLSGCMNADATDDTAAKAKEEAVISIPVEAEPLTSGEISSSYHTTAILEAKEEAFVVARASGIVEHIYVEEGDYVEKGQVLAQLDKKRYELNLSKARADLTGLEKELNKINKVHSRQLVSDDTFDKLTAQYEGAKAVLALAELDLKETTITAPISGYIAERNAKVGNLTESFQRERMFHIVQQRELQGIVYLPESEMAAIKAKQKASLQVAALGNATVNGYIERISPIVDATTGTFKVTLTVPNDGGKLKAGMFSEVSIDYATHSNATLIPRKALLTIDDRTSVFVVKDGVANKLDVTTGFENSDYVEITSGLNGSETVVTVGHHNLKDASPVDVVNS